MPKASLTEGVTSEPFEEGADLYSLGQSNKFG